LPPTITIGTGQPAVTFGVRAELRENQDYVLQHMTPAGLTAFGSSSAVTR